MIKSPGLLGSMVGVKTPTSCRSWQIGFKAAEKDLGPKRREKGNIQLWRVQRRLACRVEGYRMGLIGREVGRGVLGRDDGSCDIGLAAGVWSLHPAGEPSPLAVPLLPVERGSSPMASRPGDTRIRPIRQRRAIR